VARSQVYTAPLGVSLGHLQPASMWFMQNAMGKAGQRGRRRHGLHASFRSGRAWLHVVPDRTGAIDKLPKANGSAPRYSARLGTARFFMERMLAETAVHLVCIQSGSAATMELPDKAF
jgi:hypothetical protein